jgi:hypothetical protein
MVDTIGKMDHLARVIVGNIKEKKYNYGCV